MRKAVLTAVLLAMASLARAETPALADLDAAGRAERQAMDVRAVAVYRAVLSARA